VRAAVELAELDLHLAVDGSAVHPAAEELQGFKGMLMLSGLEERRSEINA
jgi:hypothetical protein